MTFSSDMLLCKRYRLIEKIGMGGFSDVWTARDEFINNIVVLKIFVRQDDEGIEMCRNEYKKLVYLNHPHIVRMLGLEVHAGAPILIMPFYAGGSVIHLAGKFTEPEMAELMYQMSDAIDHIHQMTPAIVHGDIKPDNFLSDAKNNYVLTDFGISEHLEGKLTKSAGADRLTKVLAGKSRMGITPMSYRAPELFSFREQKRQPPSRQTDIWALGASIYELAAGELPFGSEGGLMLLIGNGKAGRSEMDDFLPPLPDSFSDEFASLLKSCLSTDIFDRPSANFIKNSAQHYLSHGRWLLPAGSLPPVPPVAPGVKDNAPTKKNFKYAPSRKKRLLPAWAWLLIILGLPIGANGLYFYREYTVHSLRGDQYMNEQRYDEAFQAYKKADVLPYFTEKLREKTWYAHFRSSTSAYPAVRPFFEGLAAVCDSTGKFGFVDSTGRLIVGAVYDSVQDFKEGQAKVLFRKTRFLIDREGAKIKSAPDAPKIKKTKKAKG